MIKDSINTFNEGLNYDLNPITTPNNVLTDCVNGTFITFNGDELALQTDSGNTTIDYEVQVPVINIKYGALYNQWALIGTAEPEPALELTFDDIANVPVADAYSVSDWNTFFDLPVNGNPFTSVEIEIVNPITVLNGATYNGYVITDERNIANVGWRVPTEADTIDLFTTIGCTRVGQTWVGGTAALRTFEAYQLDPETYENEYSPGTNTTGFNGKLREIMSLNGNGGGTWYDPQTEYLMYVDASNNVHDILISQYQFDARVVDWYESWFNNHLRFLRLCRDAGSMSPGDVGEYTGNDGKTYPTVCIGTVEWMSEPLCETKWRTGEAIPQAPDYSYFGIRTQVPPDYNEVWVGETIGPVLAFKEFNESQSFTGAVLVRLIGGSEITLKDSLFKNNSYLIAFVDEEAIVITIMANSFDNCGATTFTMSGVTNLGGTTGNDNVFASITGKAITLTIQSALMTCNGGNPDGDIQTLMANNTVTIITV